MALVVTNETIGEAVSQWIDVEAGSTVANVLWTLQFPAADFGDPLNADDPAHIGNWDTSEVTDMSGLFRDKTSFNEDISTKTVTHGGSSYTAWDTSKVTDMNSMFNGASSFNQNISEWNVQAVENTVAMFTGASALSNDNKEAIYQSWASQQGNQTFANAYGSWGYIAAMAAAAADEAAAAAAANTAAAAANNATIAAQNAAAYADMVEAEAADAQIAAENAQTAAEIAAIAAQNAAIAAEDARVARDEANLAVAAAANDDEAVAATEALIAAENAAIAAEDAQTAAEIAAIAAANEAAIAAQNAASAAEDARVARDDANRAAEDARVARDDANRAAADAADAAAAADEAAAAFEDAAAEEAAAEEAAVDDDGTGETETEAEAETETGGTETGGTETGGTGAVTGGDPYVTTLSGITYKLDNISGVCRMLQGYLNGTPIVINAEMKKDSLQIESEMNHWCKTLPTTLAKQDRDSLYNQSFYTRFLVKYGEETAIIDLEKGQMSLPCDSTMKLSKCVQNNTEGNLAMYSQDVPYCTYNLNVDGVVLQVKLFSNKQLRNQLAVLGAENIRDADGYLIRPMSTKQCRVKKLGTSKFLKMEESNFKSIALEHFYSGSVSKKTVKKSLRIPRV